MINGELKDLLLPDLIQWLVHTQRTGKLALAERNDSIELYFAKGEIAGASTHDSAVSGSPEQVCATVSTALVWRNGRFTFNDGKLPAWVNATNLHLPAEQILRVATARLNPAPPPGQEELSEATEYSSTFTQADALRLQVVDRLLREDFQVPAMPQVATHVLELTRKDNFSLRDLGNVILTDQTIAARILRYANSALRGGERYVESLSQAVQRLGAEEVVNIVLAASLQARRGRDPFAAEKRRLWEHAATAAFIARSLAGVSGQSYHLAFLCGLLMDFGSTVLYSLIQETLSRQNAGKSLPTQLIAEIVRDYHPRIGRVIGEKWRLPQPVIEAMANHHSLEAITFETPYTAIAMLADFLATFALTVPRTELDEALTRFPPEQLAAHPAAQRVNLSTAAAAAVLAELPRNLDQALDFVID